MRISFIALSVALLTACGGGTVDRAVAACEQSLKEKAQGKTYSVDLGRVKSTAKSTAAGETDLSGEVTFDPGLPRAAKMKFECKTRDAEGKAQPDVISFSLVW